MPSKLPAVIAAVTAALAAATLATAAAAQPPDDHLKCFSAKDPRVKGTYVGDLGGLVTEDGCKIKVPAALVCVPSTSTNVQPIPAAAGGTGTPNAFGCYKVTCPKRPRGTPAPTLELEDEFGSRTVTASKSMLVCAPAVPTTLGCIEPFDAALQVALDLLARGLDASGNLDAASSCGASPALCCPGGTPVTPCGPLHIDLVSAAIDAPPGADRLDLTYRMRLATVGDIPVTIPVTGDCGIRIDSTAGATPTIQLTAQVNLTADHLHILSIDNLTISDLEAADIQLTGGVSCQIANLGLGFFAGVLTTSLDGVFHLDAGLCRRCDSAIVRCGP